MTDTPRPIRTRSRWPWVIGAIAAAIVVVLVILALTGGFGGRSAAQPTASSATPSAAPSSTSAADPAPTGCLGGPTIDINMLRAAQKAAPHTSNGAVEFTTAFVRWLYRYPVPSQAEATEAQQFAIATDAAAGYRDLAAGLAKNPNMSNGAVDVGTPFHLSTVTGVWNLESYSADTATVSVAAAFVVSGVMSPTMSSASTLTVKWQDGAWRLYSGEYKRTTAQLYSIGTKFTGGC